MTGGGRVLVTGASGFIGAHVVRALLAEGYSVRAASRTGCDLGVSEAVFVRLPDLSRAFDPSPLVEGMDYVVHLAGIAHATSAIPEDMYHVVNADAAARIAAAARDAGVKRFLLMSSVRAQSGPAAAMVIKESQPAQPNDAYGRSKLAGERAVADALRGSGTDWVILRPVLVYGPGVKGNMATLERLAHLPVPLPLGGFTGRRSLLSVANLASVVCHCLSADAARGGTFLVADGEPFTPAEIVGAMRKGLGRSPGIFGGSAFPLMPLLTLLGKQAVAERLMGDLVVDTTALRATGWSPVEDTLTALGQVASE